MAKIFFVIGSLFLLQSNIEGQNFEFASKATRDSVRKELIQKVDVTILDPINEQTLKDWKGAFWAMELMLYSPKKFTNKIPRLIKNLYLQPVSFQQSVLEMLYTVYPGKFKRQLNGVWVKLGSSKVKAMALEQLAMAKKFPDLEKDSIFSKSDFCTFYKRRWFSAPTALPDKNIFLKKDFLFNQAVLVSFQYQSRDKPGYLMIRTPDHEWLKDEKGDPLRFTQLARSITNLPWYITNGNTPQGLYKINGTDISNNKWIGPTLNLQMVMPFEDAAQEFFSDTTHSYDQYKALLGPASTYYGLYESYDAGKIGRTEIIAHGTTIPEWYYKNKAYYPCTPSLGCLCSPEIWDESGNLLKSTQKEWMKIISKLPQLPPYLLVVEIDE